MMLLSSRLWRRRAYSQRTAYVGVRMEIASAVGQRCGAATVQRVRHGWEDAEKRRQFMEDIKKAFEVREPEDWRRVTSDSIREREGGSALLARYSYSVSALLQDTYPEETLEAHVVRKKVPKGYWDSAERRRAFVRRLGERYDVREVEDWKRVSTKNVRELGGSSLLLRYSEGSAVYSLIRELHPSVEEEQCRPRKRQGFWKEREHRRQFLEELAAAKGVQKAEDWQKVSLEDFKEAEASSLLTMFNWNIEELLKDSYPEYSAQELNSVRQGHKRNRWSDKEARRAFMDGLAEKFGVVEAKDWRRVTSEEIRSHGGTGLLYRYGNSVIRLLVETYGEEMLEMELTVRGKRSKAHWNSMENQRKALLDVKKAHGVEKPEDWKRVTVSHLAELGSSSLLNRYPSFHAMLESVFPEEQFDELTCRPVVPPSYWRDSENVKAFAERLRAQLKLEEKEDWYRVSQAQIRGLGGAGLLRSMRYVDVLRMAMPDEQWDEQECSRRVKKSVQRFLMTEVKRMLPDHTEILEDHWHPALAARHGGKGFELDIFLPNHNLALEYNGEHHYQEMGFFGPVEAYRVRDNEKQRLCEEQGITLVVIPYWWDQRAESLAATLHRAAPSLPIDEELLREIKNGSVEAIAERDPEERQMKSGRPGVWDERIDPQGLWKCRRFEGVAVRFDTVSRSFHTRSSRRKLPVPQQWLARIPRESLGTAEVEGELWSPQLSVGQLSAAIFRFSRSPSKSENEGRERQERAEGVGGGEKSEWDSIRFMATDVAEPRLSFEERLRLLQAMPENEAFAAVEYTQCGDREELRRSLEEDFAAGGDGFLLRDGSSSYRLGIHTQPLLKAKHVSKADAVVVEASKTVRGLVVQLPTNGKLQIVRCSALEHMRPPARGTAVTVGHLGVWPSTGRLKHPFLLTVNV